MHLPQRFLFCFWLFAFFMQNKNVLWARLCDKLKFYDSFSHHNSFVLSLILTCRISLENGLKRRIQWYNNQNNQIKTIDLTKLWTYFPSNLLKPQMYDPAYLRLNGLKGPRSLNFIVLLSSPTELWNGSWTARKRWNEKK